MSTKYIPLDPHELVRVEVTYLGHPNSYEQIETLTLREAIKLYEDMETGMTGMNSVTIYRIEQL